MACSLAALPLALAMPAAASRPASTVYTIRDGLPSNRVNAVLPDTRGNLWIGTADGLALFDGARFIGFDRTDGLPGNSIIALLEAPGEVLWVGTSFGVARLDAGESRFTPVPYDGEQRQAGTLVRDRSGTIWMGTNDGLLRWDPNEQDRFVRIAVETGLPAIVPTEILSLAVGPDDTLWIGMLEGLCRRTPDGRQSCYEGLPDPPGCRVAFDAAGRAWLSLTDEVVVLAPEPVAARRALLSAERDCTAPSADLPDDPGDACRFDLPVRQCLGLLPEPGERAVCTTDRGICTLVAGHPPTCSGASEGIPPHVGDVARDALGLWAGTDATGLLRIPDHGLRRWGADDGLDVDLVSAVLTDSAGRLFAVSSGNLYAFDGTRWHRGPFPGLPAWTWAWDQFVASTSAGDWWVGTERGVARYRAQALPTGDPRVYTVADGLQDPNVFRVFEHSSGIVWLSTLGNVEAKVLRWDPATDRIEPPPVDPRYVSDTASAFAEDHAGNLWVGMYSGGVVRFAPDGSSAIDALPPDDPVGRTLVRDLHVDRHGRLWVATSAGVRWTDDPTAAAPTFYPLSMRDGLASDRVQSIGEDEQGRIYLATARSLDRYDPTTGAIRRYTHRDGLGSADAASIVRDRDGRLWIATVDGLYDLTPEGDPPLLPPIRPFIREVTTAGTAWRSLVGVAEVPPMTIGPADNDVRLSWMSAVRESTAWRYRLVGASDAFGPPTTDRSVELANLPPGRYRFELAVAGPDGEPGADRATVDLVVRPSLSQRWWFRLGLLCAALGVAGYVVAQRRRRLLDLVEVRTRIAMDLHDDVGASLSLLSILAEVARRQIPVRPAEADTALVRIGETARSLVEAMGDMVWSIDPKADDLGHLVARFRRSASEIAAGRGATLTITVEAPPSTALRAAQRRNLLLSLKEAVHNALRHGNAEHITVRLAMAGPELVAVVADDGTGFDPEHLVHGNGLRNMQRRMEQLGGRFELTTAPGAGATLTFWFPS